MNMEAQTDRAVEAATDSAHDAYSVSGEPAWVYTKESWADCISDIVTDPENDEELRKLIQCVLFWMARGYSLAAGSWPDKHVRAIGELIIKNAIKNGVTLANIGKVE